MISYQSIVKYRKIFALVHIFLLLPWPLWGKAWALEPNYQLENNLAAGILGIPALWTLNPGINGLGLTGKGQTVAVADAGLDGGNMETLHPDLKDRLTGVKDFSGDGWGDPNGHGTHIAGSIVGTGAKSQGYIRGMAPEAGLYFQATYNEAEKNLRIPSVYDLLNDAYNAPGQPRIHVNSWGANFSDGIYDWNSYSLDKFVWDHPDMVVLKSAGNGYKTAKPFVSSPGSAKNAVTVGSTEGVRGIDTGSDNPGQVVGFSSRGTFDGRIKPEVLAPGTWILSTRKTNPNLEGDNYIGVYNQYYGYMSGTSMSTALTAGSLALLRQYLVQKGLSPSAAQMKALLIFGTRILPGVSGSDQGFGRVDAERSIIAMDQGDVKVLDEKGLNTGEELTYTYTSNGQPFRVVMAYTDYPKTPGIGKDLVNDLDVKVTGPDGKEVYWGNGYIDGDHLNNTEGILIDKPQKGETYTIEVSASEVVHGPQPFALVYGSLPWQGTLSEVHDNELTFNDGQTLRVNQEVTIRLTDGSAATEAAINEIPAGAEVYLVYGEEGEISHLDALYNTIHSKLQAKEGSNQLVIEDGTRWSLAEEAKIFVGDNELQWSELPLEAEIELTVNPGDDKVWRVEVKNLPDNSPYYSLPLSEKDITIAIQNSRSSGKVVLSAADPEDTSKPVTLAFAAGLASKLVSNGLPVELRLPGLSIEIPVGEFGRIGKSEEGAQLQLRVAWQTVGEQSLPAADPFMYLRPVGKLVEIRPTLVWPDGSQLAISSSNSFLKVTITSPLGSTAGLNLQRLGTYRYSELSQVWGLVNIDYNPDTGRSTFYTNRFGKFGILEASRTFEDITDHWARTDIEIMAARQIVRGMAPQTFAPDLTVTRGQFTAMLVRTLGLSEESVSPAEFSDLPGDYWCAGAVGTAVKMGLVSGYGDGTFGANDPITREQMAAMLVRAMRYGTEKNLNESALNPIHFTDEENISSWARSSVAIVAQEGLMKGREAGGFAPQEFTTRAEAAVVMVRLLSYRGNNW
ncbi:peptidase S8 and S53 subtilisin kexin sedolisin [Desulforamulus ruminis DSM 2154]|uniref:Peptidase S8 and S53 subtilisin kexin sedolisin n=1 Tax=Desulforamulus ruminis (strain ATCC 23193 / DSM 2154 / NCIMB 8452 / DL) TaxID=696281 RepID=F6DNF4_DESRL|nr:peptidase S8 and S53 subtilisin kexin sedolisin [Desulforamulus ruminis DSM 2154]